MWVAKKIFEVFLFMVSGTSLKLFCLRFPKHFKIILFISTNFLFRDSQTFKILSVQGFLEVPQFSCPEEKHLSSMQVYNFFSSFFITRPIIYNILMLNIIQKIRDISTVQAQVQYSESQKTLKQEEHLKT